MKKLALVFWLAFGLAFPALAANVNIDGLPAASSVGTGDLLECEQSAVNHKCTVDQVKTFGLTSSFSVRTGTNYPFVAGDIFTIVYLNNASNQIPTLPQAGTTGFEAGKYVEACNIGAGTQTLTPTTSTIGGASTYVLPAGSAAAPKCVGINSDGTNYVLDGTGPAATPGTAAAQNIGTSGANVGLLNASKTDSGNNVYTGTNTFGSVFGTVTTQSGTTYTLAASDCGTEIAFTNASAVTVTIPAALTTGCNIAILQTTSAGQVTVTGTAVSAATLHSAHSYTKTFGQWAIIGINIETTGVAILTGDGA